VGLLDRFLRRRREEPAADAPGLFTARSLATAEQAPERPVPEQRDGSETLPPPEVVAAAPDTVEAPPPWDEAEPRSVEAPTPAGEPPIEPAPAAAEPDAWDDALWDDTPAPAPVVEPVPGDHDTPLFGDHQAPLPEPEAEPEPQPEPPLFEQPPAAAPPSRDVETVDEEGRRVRVHDGRLDTRPGPIRMSPSEALRLAEEGPRPSRRRDEPGPGASA
jgi:hypothetical protein